MVAPSRKRYEQTHPVIAIRTDPELFEKLQQLKASGYTSYADILRVAAGIHELNTKAAYDKGFQDAKEKYCVSFPCHVCHRLIEVEEDILKDACQKALIAAGWRHDDCSLGGHK